MTIMIQCQQGTDEWKAARAGVITASRFADARSTLKRASGRKSAGEPSDASDSYARLIAAERISGQPLDDTFSTWAMRRGQELEPVAREAYEIRTGSVVLESGIVLTDDRLFGYSTDGEVAGQEGGIEIKCPSATDKVAGIWLDPEPVIAEYLDQIQGGMWINGWKWLDLVVFTPWLESVGRGLFIQRIQRDDAYIDKLEMDLWAFAKRAQAIEDALRLPLEAVAA